MAKKTRTIICRSTSFEEKVYGYCDKYGVKNKNISSYESGGDIYVNIYCKKKIFDQIAFKLGGLCKFYM